MAQMNKRPSGTKDNRSKQLEDELTGQIESQKALVETGRDEKKDTKYKQEANSAYRAFATKQGRRRRHPDRVLAQFAAISETTSNAESAWEKALMHEQERVEVPSDYTPKEDDMIANQSGLVTTAMQNYEASRAKLERYHLSGV